jgi:transcriptional regulator with XRE-family HTH domain
MNGSTNSTVPVCTLIRRRRAGLSLTQAEIAAAVDVQPESVSLWENGRRRIELDRLPRVAAALQMDELELCWMALAEWHPRFYAAVGGAAEPPAAACVGTASATDAPAPVAAPSIAA